MYSVKDICGIDVVNSIKSPIFSFLPWLQTVLSFTIGLGSSIGNPYDVKGELPYTILSSKSFTY